MPTLHRPVIAADAGARLHRVAGNALAADAGADHAVRRRKGGPGRGGIAQFVPETAVAGGRGPDQRRIVGQRFVERPIGWDDKVWVSFDPDAGVVLTS